MEEMKVEEKKTRLGTASLVLGIIGAFSSLICLGFVPGIISLVFGAVCLSKKPDTTQKAFSIAGIILSVVSFIILIFLIILFLKFGPGFKNPSM